MEKYVSKYSKENRTAAGTGRADDCTGELQCPCAEVQQHCTTGRDHWSEASRKDMLPVGTIQLMPLLVLLPLLCCTRRKRYRESGNVSVCTGISDGKLKVNWDVSPCMKGKGIHSVHEIKENVCLCNRRPYIHITVIVLVMITQETTMRSARLLVSLEQTAETAASFTLFYLFLGFPLGFRPIFKLTILINPLTPK